MMPSRFIVALIFVINTLFGLYTAAVLLRFLLQRARADFYNPLCQAVVKITNPPLLPLRRMIPGWRNLDLAALVLAFLVQLGNVLLVLLAASVPFDVLTLVYWTCIKLIFVVVNLFFFTILLEAVMSWIGQGRGNPMAGLLWPLNAPLLRPARRVLPPLGGLDFSPLLVMLLLQVINILLPLNWPLA